jgi:hypothetical protein
VLKLLPKPRLLLLGCMEENPVPDPIEPSGLAASFDPVELSGLSMSILLGDGATAPLLWRR